MTSIPVAGSGRATSHRWQALVRRFPLITFFTLANSISWLAWLPYILSLDGFGVLHFRYPDLLVGNQLTAILPGAYLAAWLCGERVADPATASSTMLLDLASRTWATDLVADLGLEPRQLGAIAPAHTPVGALRPDVAAALGLPAGVPVVTGTGDEFGACLGAGVVDPGLMRCG